MLFTSQSIFFTSSVFLSAVQAQPHGHTHQHATSKRASTGVVSGRGIVYAYGDTGLEALDGKLAWSTDWSGWADVQNANLGPFAPQVWGLDNPENDFLTAFLNGASSFTPGSTILGFNEPDQIAQSWLTPQEAADNWGKIDALRNSINGAKICTPCPSNGEQTGTSGVGNKTQQYQSGIDQGTQWTSEFLAAATEYKFDCLCGHWYGGPANTVAADQALIETQIGKMVTLAEKYSIGDIVISEMGRMNGDHECEFVAWFQDTFLVDSQYKESGNKITAYSYNYAMSTLTSGSTLTHVGKAYVGDIPGSACTT